MKKEHPKWLRIIVGDFNSTLGKETPTGRYVGATSLDECLMTDMGYRFLEFLNEKEMFALNTLFEVKKPAHRITYRLGRVMKWLDYFVADTWLSKCCMNARTYPSRSGAFESNYRC